MLSRAAARALKSPAQSHVSIAYRGYAKAGKPKTTQFVPTVKKGSSIPSATGAARQTSPGTAIPKDKTWKPQDSIKFGGPGAAAGAAAGGAGSAASAASPELNTEPASQPGPTEPQPQASSPATPSEAANEEFRSPASAADQNTAPETEQAPPSTPLPDLRQGIPSTFFEEFNKSQKAGASKEDAVGDEKNDGASEPSSSPFANSGRRPDSEEQDYDNSDYETSIDRRRAQLYKYGYLSLLAFIATGAAYFSRPYDESENAEGLAPEYISGWAPAAMWARVLGRWNAQTSYYTEPTFPKLLPEVPEAQRPPYTLVLSLEDLMIHSSWTREHGWRTAKRPGIDYFLRYLSQYYELVLFTTAPVAMADPVVKKLDPFRIIQWPLFREGTRYENGEYVKVRIFPFFRFCRHARN